jgi:hypothetical protein
MSMCAKVAPLVSITTEHTAAPESRRGDFAASVEIMPDLAVSRGSVGFATHSEGSSSRSRWLDFPVGNNADNSGHPLCALRQIPPPSFAEVICASDQAAFLLLAFVLLFQENVGK